MPKAFTERGLYMLATILKGPKAEETTIAIVEAYAKLRELAQVIAEVSQHEDDKAEQHTRASALIFKWMGNGMSTRVSWGG